MTHTSSVGRWLIAARSGDSDAVEKLWNRFSDNMRALSARWLASVCTSPAFDEDDVTVSAFEAFRRALLAGHYDNLKGRDELWRLLATITIRKSGEFLDAEQALKRGGKVALISLDESGPANAARLSTEEPPPDVAAMMVEECRRLLDVLGDRELEAVAMWKLEGFSNDDISLQIGYSKRTVVRMLNRIRARWRDEAGTRPT